MSKNPNRLYEPEARILVLKVLAETKDYIDMPTLKLGVTLQRSMTAADCKVVPSRPFEGKWAQIVDNAVSRETSTTSLKYRGLVSQKGKGRSARYRITDKGRHYIEWL